MNYTLGLSALAFGLVLAVAGTARADVPPPNSTECTSLQPGDACMTDSSQPGICTSSTCSKLDYSDGSPPGTVTYACVLCDPTDGGSGSSSGSGTGSGSSSSGSGSTPSGGGCSLVGTGALPGGSSWAWLGASLALLMLRRRAR
jgi:hypothetical protein